MEAETGEEGGNDELAGEELDEDRGGMALTALALVAGSGLAQEFDYTLEELEEKIDKSPWGPSSCWPAPD